MIFLPTEVQAEVIYCMDAMLCPLMRISKDEFHHIEYENERLNDIMSIEKTRTTKYWKDFIDYIDGKITKTCENYVIDRGMTRIFYNMRLARNIVTDYEIEVLTNRRDL